jgi:hypothetical protein
MRPCWLLLIIIRDASGRSVVTYVKENIQRVCVRATLAHGNFLRLLASVCPGLMGRGIATQIDSLLRKAVLFCEFEIRANS